MRLKILKTLSGEVFGIGDRVLLIVGKRKRARDFLYVTVYNNIGNRILYRLPGFKHSNASEIRDVICMADSDLSPMNDRGSMYAAPIYYRKYLRDMLLSYIDRWCIIRYSFEGERNSRYGILKKNDSGYMTVNVYFDYPFNNSYAVSEALVEIVCFCTEKRNEELNKWLKNAKKKGQK